MLSFAGRSRPPRAEIELGREPLDRCSTAAFGPAPPTSLTSRPNAGKIRSTSRPPFEDQPCASELAISDDG